MRAEWAARAGFACPRAHGAVGCPRSGDMNEATRRLLGVLLRQMDGFASANNRSVVIGATNRRQARPRRAASRPPHPATPVSLEHVSLERSRAAALPPPC